MKEEAAQNASSTKPGITAIDQETSTNFPHINAEDEQLDELEEGTRVLPGRVDFVSNNEEVSLQPIIQIILWFNQFKWIYLTLLF